MLGKSLLKRNYFSFTFILLKKYSFQAPFHLKKGSCSYKETSHVNNYIRYTINETNCIGIMYKSGSVKSVFISMKRQRLSVNWKLPISATTILEP